MDDNENTLFTIVTQLSLTVRTSQRYWETISTVKHPSMRERIEDVKMVLFDPDQVHQSRGDPQVRLFYKQDRPNRWLRAVVKRLNGDGFLVTAYLTDAIKEGVQIWKK